MAKWEDPSRSLLQIFGERAEAMGLTASGCGCIIRVAMEEGVPTVGSRSSSEGSTEQERCNSIAFLIVGFGLAIL